MLLLPALNVRIAARQAVGCNFTANAGPGNIQVAIDCPVQAGVRGLVIFHAYHKAMTRDK